MAFRRLNRCMACACVWRGSIYSPEICAQK